MLVQFPLALPAAGGPTFARIARAVVEDVQRGRLRPGVSLPGSRTLAQSLGVTRNTVVAAYEELKLQGWVETRLGGGSFVSTQLPESGFPSPDSAPTCRLAYGLRRLEGRPERGPYPPGTLVLAWGVPDVRQVPAAALARAYRRAVTRRGRRVLDYGEPSGDPRLRAQLAGWLGSARGLAASPENVLVTRGSQMALDLVARALFAPGDAVAVEAPGYPPAWGAFRLSGAALLPIPVDAEGLDLAALERACRAHRLRAVYVTPHHQYPTTVGLSQPRRLALLALAKRHRFAVLEDDYDHEFHYEGRPRAPLAAGDESGAVIYVGTLSKILAPGVRLGFVCAPKPLIDRLIALRGWSDRQGDLAVESAVAELLEDGEVQRHARKMRRLYRARRDVLADALTRAFGARLPFTVPTGGIALWAQAPDVDVERWSARALEEGVAFAPASQFAFDGRARRALRMSFASLDERDLLEAVTRMRRALPKSRIVR